MRWRSDRVSVAQRQGVAQLRPWTGRYLTRERVRQRVRRHSDAHNHLPFNGPELRVCACVRECVCVFTRGTRRGMGRVHQVEPFFGPYLQTKDQGNSF